jgi:hypothetical protein
MLSLTIDVATGHHLFIRKPSNIFAAMKQLQEINPSNLDTDDLKAIYSGARNTYRPSQIKTLIVAEAPPCATDRFFYFEDVKKQDSLFLEIVGVLYPKEKEMYLSSGRQTLLKAGLLERFRADGYWLYDLCEIPTSIVPGPSGQDAQHLLHHLKALITHETPIILIKANVYDLCYDLLASNGYNVINDRLPFPGSGQQKVFREKFKQALER